MSGYIIKYPYLVKSSLYRFQDTPFLPEVMLIIRYQLMEGSIKAGGKSKTTYSHASQIPWSINQPNGPFYDQVTQVSVIHQAG